MLKTQSKDRSFIADVGLKGTGFLFRFLNKLKMLGVFIFLPFAGVEAMSAFFCFFAFRAFPLPFRLPRMLSRTRFCWCRCFESYISSSCRFNSSRTFLSCFFWLDPWTLISRIWCPCWCWSNLKCGRVYVISIRFKNEKLDYRIIWMRYALCL